MAIDPPSPQNFLDWAKDFDQIASDLGSGGVLAPQASRLKMYAMGARNYASLGQLVVPTTPTPKITKVTLSSDANGQRIDFETDSPVKTYGHDKWTSPVQDPARRTFDLTFLAADTDIPVKVTWLDDTVTMRVVHTAGAVTPPIPQSGTLNPKPVSALKGSMAINFHRTYPAYAETLVASTAKLKEITNIIRLDFPGEITYDDGRIDPIGIDIWKWIVDNQLKVVYISEGTKFKGWCSHARNRQIMESVPGAKECLLAAEAANEDDSRFSNNIPGWQADVNDFCAAWKGFDLVAPSVGDWRNPKWYGAFKNDARFKYGNSHSYTGAALSPSQDQMDLAIANLRITVPSGPWMTGECGHGAYKGGIGPDGTTGPNPGNPPVTEEQKAISNVLEIIERHRRGSMLTALYEGKNQTPPGQDVNYETRLGQWALDNTDLPASIALRNLSRLYSGPDPKALTPLPVTITGGDANTRYDLHQDSSGWLLSVYQLGNNPSPVDVTVTFSTPRVVIVQDIVNGGSTLPAGPSLTRKVRSTSSAQVLAIA